MEIALPHYEACPLQRASRIIPAAMNRELAKLDPVPALLKRVEAELSESFSSDRRLRVSRAPGRLDVMGGIADYTGAMVCQSTLQVATTVALQERRDRQLQVFSFNLYDANQPFTFQMPIDALASYSAEKLKKEFAQPGRRWAGYVAGCLFQLHHHGLIDLSEPAIKGINLAILSTVPLEIGLASSAALEVATTMNLTDHFGLRRQYAASAEQLMEPMKLARLCQQAESTIVGAPCGIMDQVACCLGPEDALLRLLCQPHQLQPPLQLPPGIRVVGINSNVRHSTAGIAYARTRCAAFMGHSMILDKMREIGAAAGQTLVADPMNGYLANLPLPDYKKYFRQFLPTAMRGIDFLEKFGPTIDNVTVINPDINYPIQRATDHHVYEAHRIRNFINFLQQARAAPQQSKERSLLLDKAGHLMYASNLAYRDDAMLGKPECDVIVDLVRKHERGGLYGARITGSGEGGTIAVLAEDSERSEQALGEILQEYHDKTDRTAEIFRTGSPGAWSVGTALV